jgi:hypothetical protein
MRAEAPFLLGANLGGWLSQSDKRYMVRTLDGTARAFLSDRYRRIDNYEIAQATLPIIGGMPDAKVESCEVTENRMYIKVVNPRLEAEVQKGDIVQAGIVISNSEVGLGSVSVMPLVYRLACLNGMIVNDLGKRKYHEEFLRPFFDPGETVCLRVFDDRKTGSFKGAKLECEAGKIAAIMDTLKKHNAQNRGIYFVINFGGHEDSDISRINAQFVECDSLSIDEQLTRISAGAVYDCQNAEITSHLLADERRKGR